MARRTDRTGARGVGALLAIALLAATGVVVAAGEPAGAICVPPEVEIGGRETTSVVLTTTPVVVPRESATVTILGRGWGDDCNDTRGPGRVLGDPVQGITLTFRHGAVEQVLATVSADDCYRFRVPVVLPFGDDEDAATLRVAGPGRHEEKVVERQIVPGDGTLGTTVPVLEATPEEVCSFGGGSFRDVEERSLLVPIGAAGALMVVGGVAVVLSRRRHRTG